MPSRPSQAVVPFSSSPDQPASASRRSPRLGLAISAALALGGHGLPALAQEGATPEVVDVNESQRLLRASSLKFTRPLLDTAQTVHVIPKDLIEQRGATTLRDVLRNASGVSMQAGEGGSPAGDQMSIRGFSARTDIFVDNVRDFGGYTRDPFNLEQVEVVKGPSSDYSGRGSTGGSINLVSKLPRLQDLGSTSLAVGIDGYTRASADLNRVLPGTNGTAARLNVLYLEQDVSGRDEVRNRRVGVAPSLAFGLDGDTQVSVGLFHLQQDNLPDYGIPWVPAGNTELADYADQAPPVDFSNWYGLTGRDFEEVQTSMATVQLDQQFSDTLRLRNLTRLGLTDRDSMITAPRFVSNSSTDIRRSDEKYRDDEDGILSNQSNLTLDINSGQDWEHRILLGLEFNLEDQKRYTQALTGSDSPATDLYVPTPGDPYFENYQRTGTFSSADATTVATYLGDSVQINERWQLNGGLRYEEFNLEYTPAGGSLVERKDQMLSYRAGLVYKPVPEASVYLGRGISFNPSSEALSLTNSSRSPGLSDLDPEENLTTELGVKWELFDRRLLATAAVFRSEKTNARTEDPDDPNDLLVLQGEQQVDGIELGLAGNVTPRLSLYAGYTWLDSAVTDSKDPAEVGQQLPNSPEHSFNLWGTWALHEDLQLGLGAQYVDERYNSIANTRRAPEYWIFEASATWMLSVQLNLRLNAQNLTDEEYIDFVGGGHFIPGQGRLVMLSSTFAF